MNSLIAAESLARIIATAAHGGDQDDGYAISDDDMGRLDEISRWLFAGAVDSGQVKSLTLPTVNIEALHMLAVVQAHRRYGTKVAASAAMGIDQSTFWRWRKRAAGHGQ